MQSCIIYEYVSKYNKTLKCSPPFYRDDLKGVRLLIGVGAIIALLSAVALGIGYALGDRQVRVVCPSHIIAMISLL